jgi:ankyrin repeat protein
MHQPSKLLQRQSLPLVALVEMFRSWLATDPLDKVYALLAFSSDAHDAAELQPDYTLSKYQLASKLIQYTFPACAVEQNCSNTDSATFKIEGLILGGINTKMSGGGKNKRTWHFRSPELSDLSAAPGMKLNATVSKLFQEPWEISVSNERKFQIGSFVCLLHGASLPTILRFHEGEYLVEMLAAPEPTRWIRKEKEQENWTEVMNILAMESDCTMDFKLTWDPFRQPLSSEVSLYTPTPYSFTTQWAALMEQFRESADPMSNGFGDRNENHDCHSMSNMWLQYRSELKHKVQSGEMKAGESKYIITIHHAAFRGHVGAIKVLVEANAEVDAQSEGEGAAPIHLASIYNHDLVVKALLEAKATVDIRDKEGRTALALAAKYGHLRIVEILLEAGASVDSRDITHGTTPLYAAIVGGFREIGGYLDVVKLLLKGNANANIADNQERLSPLHFAAESGNTQLAKELLDANAEVDARAKGGTTALHLAAQQNHLETVRVILDAGANVNAADDNGVTALHFACNFGHHEIVTELLLDESAEVNPETNSGGTPLDFAKDDPETVAALFSRLV